MYTGFEQITVSSSVLTESAFTIPAETTHVELQADTQPVRYTMDGTAVPTASSGMILLTTSDPKTFSIEDLKNIKMIRGAGSDAEINVHYFGG